MVIAHREKINKQCFFEKNFPAWKICSLVQILAARPQVVAKIYVAVHI